MKASTMIFAVRLSFTFSVTTGPCGKFFSAFLKIFRGNLRGFDGMTEMPVSLESLHEARERLKKDIVAGMPQAHRRFLVSFEEGRPDWSLLDVKGAVELPAVKWRQQNLDKLDDKRRADLVTRLREVLGA
jgi:hypothetical protein